MTPHNVLLNLGSCCNKILFYIPAFLFYVLMERNEVIGHKTCVHSNGVESLVGLLRWTFNAIENDADELNKDRPRKTQRKCKADATDENDSIEEATQDDDIETMSTGFKPDKKSNFYGRFKPDIDHIKISQNYDVETCRARRAIHREMTREYKRLGSGSSVLFPVNSQPGHQGKLCAKKDIQANEYKAMEIYVYNGEVLYRNNESDDDCVLNDTAINMYQNSGKTFKNNHFATIECMKANRDVANNSDTKIILHEEATDVPKSETIQQTIYLTPTFPKRLTGSCHCVTANKKSKRVVDQAIDKTNEALTDVKCTPRNIGVSVRYNFTSTRSKISKTHSDRNHTAKYKAPLQQGPDKGIVWPKTIEALGQQEKCYYVEQFTRTELYRQRCRRKVEGSVMWMNGLTHFQHWVIQYSNTSEVVAILHPTPKRTNNAKAKVSCWRREHSICRLNNAKLY